VTGLEEAAEEQGYGEDEQEDSDAVVLVPGAVLLTPSCRKGAGFEGGCAVIDGEQNEEGMEDDGDPEGCGCGNPRQSWLVEAQDSFESHEEQAGRVPDEKADPPALVLQVGKTELRYHLRCLEDLLAMLKAQEDWVLLDSADEQKPAAEGTVEAWARSAENPVRGCYGLKKGLRGRFAMYVPPVLIELGLAEVENNPRNKRMRAK
jgi:hypothetical protein